MTSSTLPPRLEQVLKQFVGLGYREPTGTVIPNYDYPAAKGKVRTVDLLACADTLHFDLNTSCIAAQECPSGDDGHVILKDLQYLGVPLVWLLRPNIIEVWQVPGKGAEYMPQPKETVSYSYLPEYCHKYQRDLSPRALLGAKTGERQLSFFDVDPSLVGWARDATQKTLADLFHDAIESTPEIVRKNNRDELTHVAICVLAARILQDKLVAYPDLQTTDALSLLGAVRNHFPQYFRGLEADIAQVGTDVVQQLYKRLRDDFTFRSLTNDMLAYFYENTLATAALRKEHGIFYTPRTIAHEMLQRLPVEDLAPEDRVVFDGTCGSGNLLLAAYDRLSRLLPAKMAPEHRHQYLLQHLLGIDADAFACEVARLSLLLYDLPEKDGWQIKIDDIFKTTPEAAFGVRPHIIVGNPPFSESHTRRGKPEQKAAVVLERYLEWLAPGGLLGVVLPATFLTNPTAQAARKKLLESCDVLEVWRLPERAIPSSSIATTVVLARKFPVQGSDTRRFLTRIEEQLRIRAQQHDGDRVAIRYVVPQDTWLASRNWGMRSSTRGSLWRMIEKRFRPMDDTGRRSKPTEHTFGMLLNGVRPGRVARPTHLSDHDRGDGWCRVLAGNAGGRALEPFAVHWEAQQGPKYIKYPSKDLERERTPEHFQRPVKLIVSAQRNAGSPWRFYSAIDRDQLVVTESFHYVLAVSATPEELAALLNSMAANDWYASKMDQWNVQQDMLKRLPFPTFTPEQREELRDIVARITGLMQTSQLGRDYGELSRLFFVLDEIVFDAYGINDVDRSDIRAEMEQYRRPGMAGVESAVKSVAIPTGSRLRWMLTGAVEDVDIENHAVDIWIEGHPSATRIPIPATMPGWALRPGAAFQVRIPKDQRFERDLTKVAWEDFQPLDFGYLSYEDLLSRLVQA